MTEAEVETLVRRAFAKVERPPDDFLTASVGDEQLEDTEPFREKMWSDVDHDLLSRYHYAYSWFTPKAFHYFLPAILTNGLKDPKAVYVISLLMFLKPTDDPTLQRFRKERWALLTLPQIETLERWLECLARARPQVREEFEDALEVVTKRYWW